MKVAIFGGTGRTGQLVVQQALASGYDVIILARMPAKLSIQHEKLSFVTGELLDAGRVNEVIQGSDGVLSVLGSGSNKPDYVVARGMKLILTAMQTNNVRRIIMSAGAGVRQPGDKPKSMDYLMGLLLRVFAKNVLSDMQEAVREVQASDRDWTIVRVPMLTDQPSQATLKVGLVGDIRSRLSRTDLAAFMVKQLTESTYIRKAPAISN